MAEREGGVMDSFLRINEIYRNYRTCMEVMKRAEQLTPKEYGMMLQRSKKKRKVIKRGK